MSETRVAWVVAALTIATAPVTAWLTVRGDAPADIGRNVNLVELVPTIAYALTGLVVARARPRNSIGWILLGVGLLSGLLVLAEAYGQNAHDARWPAPTFAFWVATWAWVAPLLVPATVLLIRYPTGMAPTKRWSQLERILIVGIVAQIVALAFAPDAVDDHVEGLTNPIAFPPLSAAAFAIMTPTLLIGGPVCWIGTLRRVWGSSTPERQPLVLLLFTAGPAVLFSGVVGNYQMFIVALTLVPFAVAVGVLRYRLLEIEVIVRRTLVYGTLTVLVALALGAATAVTTTALSERTRTVLVAGFVAIGLVPARDRLQRAVDHLLYGDRREPLRAVERLGRHVAQAGYDSLVPAVLATVAEALRVPGCAAFDADGAELGSHGTVPDSGSEDIPLIAAGAPVGCVRVAPRTRSEPLDAVDRELLATLAPQVAVVIHAARLAQDLDQARDRVVAVRADERRRLRHDLHDGLGPSLAGVALGLEAAHSLVGGTAPQVQDLLGRLRQEVRAAVDEIRRIIDDLRPLELDQVGLIAAVRERADAVDARVPGIEVSVDLTPTLPDLDPEVEAAALRIVSEALANSVRHSGATHCGVALHHSDDRLQLTISDDGHGIEKGGRDGVGLQSMRDRAAAVGGALSVQTGPAGTAITAVLPLTVATPTS